MTSDEDLVARSIDGDTDSFNQLVKRWERPIYALAYRTLGRDEDARDVTQETFLRAFRSIGGFRGQAKFSSWLYRIALNLCRDWLRKQRRAPVVQAPEGVDIIELASEPDPGESIEDVVARQNLSAHVQRAMTQLSEEQRSTIILKEYQGLTFQEIADLQGCPLSTVKTRLYQGLTVLRRELDRQGIESLAGGKAGAPAVVTLTTPDGATRHLPSKGAFLAPAGSVVDMITPGSGGFGPVGQRDPAAIARDLLDGYVSERAAREDYGVSDPEAFRAAAVQGDEA
jgi:RNA polymerase sigma-70 factor (ECF subfamily)